MNDSISVILEQGCICGRNRQMAKLKFKIGDNVGWREVIKTPVNTFDLTNHKGIVKSIKGSWVTVENSKGQFELPLGRIFFNK